MSARTRGHAPCGLLVDGSAQALCRSQRVSMSGLRKVPTAHSSSRAKVGRRYGDLRRCWTLRRRGCLCDRDLLVGAHEEAALAAAGFVAAEARRVEQRVQSGFGVVEDRAIVDRLVAQLADRASGPGP